jgi:glucose-1-phosphate cytidylyltransferase
MRVVLFCGGMGMRLREVSERVPKPMVTIGYRPILWNVMKYYAHFGHKDFILCLGYGADIVKDYFLKYDECVSNDFILSKGGSYVELLSRDIEDWRITFAYTGVNTSIGQRLRAVQKYLGEDEIFFANYSDGLTDLQLPDYIGRFAEQDCVAGLLSVRPTFTTHVIRTEPSGVVTKLEDMDRSGIRINGGYFIFRREIFSYIKDREELVHEPFQRLMKEHKLWAYNYDGFWAAMDTFKDKQQLDDLLAKGNPPWQVWNDFKAI